MSQTKLTVKACTIAFILFMFFSMMKNISYNLKGHFEYNNTFYTYDLTINLNKSLDIYNACINSTCYNVDSDTVDKNITMIEAFNVIYNTTFNENNTKFKKMIDDNLIRVTYLEDPISYLIYMPTYIFVLLFL